MYVCQTCGFDLWIPVATLGVSTLGFYNDGRFPGRCILALNDHEEHLHETDPLVAATFMHDMQQAARAIVQATGCVRMNYAVLGNTVEHVHTHLIPRYADDPVATRPIWEHPDPQFKLADDVVADLVRRIQDKL